LISSTILSTSRRERDPGARMESAIPLQALAWLLAALSGLTLTRLWVAASVPLAPDEAYYWVWSRALATGYFDHPPMVALFIRFGTWLAGDTALGVRLLGPISAALGAVMIWHTGQRLFPRLRAGLVGATMLTAMPLFGAGAIIITPDTPLLLFWTGGLWAMAQIATGASPWWWLVVGLFSGLAMASKLSALFLIVGIILWLVVAARHWLRRPAPYFAAVAALIVFAPVVWWNANHGWVTFIKQGGRVLDWHPVRAGQFLLELVGGQLALATPILLVLFVAGVSYALRQARHAGDAKFWLLASVGIVTGIAMVQHAFGDRVQPNWPAIFYPAAAIAAAALPGSAWGKWRVAGIVVGFAATAIIYLQAIDAPFSLLVAREPVTRQLGGWQNLAVEIDVARLASGASFIAIDNYGVAAELAMAMPPDVEVVAFAPRWLHFDLPAARLAGRKGLLIVNNGGLPSGRLWKNVAMIGNSTRRSGDALIAAYPLYRVTARASVAAVELPRPKVKTP